MFVPYGKNCAADFATHHCCAFGNPWMACPAISKSIIDACPSLYQCFHSQSSSIVMVLIWFLKAVLTFFTCQEPLM